MRNALQRFMYGRYGGDQLSLFLLVLYVVFTLLSGIFDALHFLAAVCVIWGFLRMLSRNIPRRQAENAKFLALAGPAMRWFKLKRTMHRDKEHRYFKCPNCGQQLRAPRGKGKIHVTCRSCGTSFDETT